jgi:hypothetical protein
MIRIVRKGFFGTVSMIISVVITSLILLWLWSLFNPADLLVQIVLLAILAIVGVMLFFVIMFFFTAVSMLLFILLLRRKMKKTMKKMFDQAYE